MRLFVTLLAIAAAPCAHAAGDLVNLPAAILRIKPSIVAVGTYEATRNPSFQITGTGFSVGNGTLIATNSHVVPSLLDPERKEVVSIGIPQSTGDVTIRGVTVLARDLEHDLVLLQIKGAPVPAAALADSDGVREGQQFGFIGFPIGSVLGLRPVTHRALVSSITPIVLPMPTSRQLDPIVIKRLRADQLNVFQLDATAYPGNSGSPLFDPETGEVVAVINMVFVKVSKESMLAQPSGIGYAIPANYLRSLVEKAAARPDQR